MAPVAVMLNLRADALALKSEQPTACNQLLLQLSN